MKKIIIISGIGAFIYFLLTRRSRPKPPKKGLVADVFKGMVDEMKKPLEDVAKDIPGAGTV